MMLGIIFSSQQLKQWFNPDFPKGMGLTYKQAGKKVVWFPEVLHNFSGLQVEVKFKRTSEYLEFK